jgi:hypothetical protein
MTTKSSDNKEILEALRLLDKLSPPLKHEKGDYCEFADDDDPDSLVVFRRKDGTPTMWMPYETYLEILNYKEPNE